jgi:hypothetical protein
MCLGMPLDKYKELMQHPQASTYPNWLPGVMWQMAKNYRTKFQNGVLPFYNKLGSGQTWHDVYECTKKAIWHEFATKSNLAQEKKGVNGSMDVHVPKLSYSNTILWGLTNYGLCNGRLNINLRGRSGESKMKPVQVLHLSRSKSRELAKAKLTPQTFTDIDLGNKANIVKNGHPFASKAYEVTSADGETGKGIAPTTLNACARLNNLLKAQKLNKADWEMIK